MKRRDNVITDRQRHALLVCLAAGRLVPSGGGWRAPTYEPHRPFKRRTLDSLVARGWARFVPSLPPTKRPSGTVMLTPAGAQAAKRFA